MDVVWERIRLSRPQSTIGLTEGNEQFHRLLESDSVLGILRPKLILLGSVLEWRTTRILLGPLAFESISCPLVWEVNANKQIVVAST